MPKKPYWLEVGDVIVLKEGHRVYADVEERLIYTNTPKSKKLSHHDVTIGKQFAALAGAYVVYERVTGERRAA